MASINKIALEQEQQREVLELVLTNQITIMATLLANFNGQTPPHMLDLIRESTKWLSENSRYVPISAKNPTTTN